MASKTKKKTADAKKRSQTKKGAARKAGRGDSFEARLKAAVSAVEVANSLSAPLADSIENLLRIAAQAVGSDQASVLVRDGNEGGLRFLVALSDMREKLMKVRIPPGKGIAGLVFSTGQPMAVADVSKEGSFWSEADKHTGFKTITLLATPLRAREETVGVLEFVNRPGEPPYDPFSPEEMDTAAFFADAIATLVDANETAGLIETFFQRSLDAAFDPDRDKDGRDDVRQWLEEVRCAPEHRDLLQLAISLRDIASRGDAERQLCRDILDSLARWTEKRSVADVGYFGF
jgi:GAF domain-containing protein